MIQLSFLRLYILYYQEEETTEEEEAMYVQNLNVFHSVVLLKLQYYVLVQRVPGVF